MRKIISLMHISLDGYTAGVNGEFNWVSLDEGLFDFVGKITEQSDTALYGRKTFEMMDAYWPEAGKQPDATAHELHHSKWYANATKIVLSNSMKSGENGKTIVIGDQAKEKLQKIKQEEGTPILLFGSNTATHYLLQEDLIDEFWLMVNPILLGNGIPMFKGINKTRKLKFLGSKTFDCGVIGLNYGM